MIYLLSECNGTQAEGSHQGGAQAPYSQWMLVPFSISYLLRLVNEKDIRREYLTVVGYTEVGEGLVVRASSVGLPYTEPLSTQVFL